MRHTPFGPYAENVRDLLRRPGDMRERQRDVPSPEKLGEGLVSVEAGTVIHEDLRFEVIHDGILVTDHVTTEAAGVCGRCLDAITVPVDVEFQELFAYPQDEAFDFEILDDHVDLELPLRDAVILSLPFQPVCREDCPGLDPETGEHLDELPEREPQTPVDPRWGALAGLRVSSDGDPKDEASEDMSTGDNTPDAETRERD